MSRKSCLPSTILPNFVRPISRSLETSARRGAFVPDARKATCWTGWLCRWSLASRFQCRGSELRYKVSCSTSRVCLADPLKPLNRHQSFCPRLASPGLALRHTARDRKAGSQHKSRSRVVKTCAAGSADALQSFVQSSKTSRLHHLEVGSQHH